MSHYIIMDICKMSVYLGGKGCIIAVILLLVGVSIVPDLGANGTFDNTIYVDGNNAGGPWDGTTEHPYQHIQDGIDAASDGDTVYVYSGLYYENVVVDKAIDLIGEGRATTIVDGNETAFVIKIDADSVTLCNFTVQNSSIESSAVGGIMVESNYNSITSNNVYNNCIGIHLIYSNNNIVHGNEISFNFIPGIRLLNSTNNVISGNIVDSNGLDVLQYYLVPGINFEQSSNNILLDNTFSNNAVGISLTYSSNNNIISGNDVKNNEYAGINLTDSSGNYVSRNIISNNNEYGIYVDDSPDNRIVQNNIIMNERNAYFKDCDNTWDGNYWNRFRLLPYLILGKTNSKLRVEADWHPSKIPNEIVSNPFAIIETNMGTMKLELYKDKVPITVENFIKLANDGFYDDLVFHRVIDDFVIQGGGYYANGTYKTSPYGSIELEIHPDVRHVDGAISMARTSDPNSATSQFFICDGKQSFLDDNYAAFGKIIVGIDVLRDAASVETTTKYRMQDWPVDDVIIESVTILNQ